MLISDWSSDVCASDLDVVGSFLVVFDDQDAHWSVICRLRPGTAVLSVRPIWGVMRHGCKLSQVAGDGGLTRISQTMAERHRARQLARQAKAEKRSGTDRTGGGTGKRGDGRVDRVGRRHLK